MKATQRTTSHSIDLPSVSAAHGCLIILALLSETVTRYSAPLSLFGVPEDKYRLATGVANAFAQVPCLDWHSTLGKDQYASRFQRRCHWNMQKQASKLHLP